MERFAGARQRDLRSVRRERRDPDPVRGHRARRAERPVHRPRRASSTCAAAAPSPASRRRRRSIRRPPPGSGTSREELTGVTYDCWWRRKRRSRRSRADWPATASSRPPSSNMRAEIWATRPTTASTVMSIRTQPLACGSGRRAARMLLSRLVPNVGRPIASLMPLGARSASTARAPTSCATSTPPSVPPAAAASRASCGRCPGGRADRACAMPGGVRCSICVEHPAAPRRRHACAAGTRAAARSRALRRTAGRSDRRRRRCRSPAAPSCPSTVAAPAGLGQRDALAADLDVHLQLAAGPDRRQVLDGRPDAAPLDGQLGGRDERRQPDPAPERAGGVQQVARSAASA